jgi:hypothetical protein
VASWRPLLGESQPRAPIAIHTDNQNPYQVRVSFVNIGVGPAFATKASLTLGVTDRPSQTSYDLQPKIVPPGGPVVASFTLWPKSDGDGLIISNSIRDGGDLWITIRYHDIGAANAWQSRARLRHQGGIEWLMTDIDIAVIEKEMMSLGETSAAANSS